MKCGPTDVPVDVLEREPEIEERDQARLEDADELLARLAVEARGKERDPFRDDLPLPCAMCLPFARREAVSPPPTRGAAPETAAYPIGLRSPMREIATVSAGSCKRTADSGQNLGVFVAGG